MINETELSRQFCVRHPAEAAAVLMRVAPDAAAAFVVTLPPPRAAALLQYMLPLRAAEILLRLEAEPLSALLSRINLTEAAGMLRPLGAEQRRSLLDRLPASLHARLARVVGYPHGTVGSLLATPPLTLLDDWTVKFSLRELRAIPPAAIAELPVVEQHHVYLGTVSLHRLLSQRDDLRVGHLVDASSPPLPAEAPLVSVAQHPLWDRTTAAPVVDHDNKLLGVLHHARLREHLSGHAGQQGLNSALTPMMALAEVYWTGFSALVALLGERFHSPRK